MSKTNVTNFKRKATLAANKAENTITEANTLLGIPDDVALANNLSNSIDNLIGCKEKMDSCEPDIQAIVNEKPNSTTDERQKLEKELRDHLVSVEFPQLYEQIAEKMDMLQQKLNAVSTACRGSSAHSLPRNVIQNSMDSAQDQHQNDGGNNGSQTDNHGSQATPGEQPQETNMQSRMGKIENTLANLVSLVQGLSEDVCRIRGNPSSRDTSATGNQGSSPRSTGSENSSQPPFHPMNPQPFGLAPGFNPRFYSGFNQGANIPQQNNGYYQNNPMATIQQQQRMSTENFEMNMRMEQIKTMLVSSIMSTLKPFSGEACDYPSFLAQFNHMVHNNPYIDSKVKQTLLTNLLPSTLAREHQTTEVSEEKYNMIRQNLERQFNRQNSQFNITMRNLENIKFPADDSAKLQSALNTYSTLAYKLQAEDLNPNDRFFIAKMVDKLPYKLRRAGQKMMSQGKVTLNDVMNKVYEIIASEEGIAGESPKLALGYDENYVNNIAINTISSGQSRHRQPSANNKGGTAKRSFIPPGNEVPCRYCNDKKHAASECNASHQRKTEAVNDKKLCRNCLSEKHTAIECRSRHKCANCDRRHFTGHCPQLKNNYRAEDFPDLGLELEDDEELEQQLFQESGAETPEH